MKPTHSLQSLQIVQGKKMSIGLKLLIITQNASHGTGLLQVTQKHFLFVEHFCWLMLSFFRMYKDWTKEICSSIPHPHLLNSAKKPNQHIDERPFLPNEAAGCSERPSVENECTTANSNCTAGPGFYQAAKIPPQSINTL